MADKSLTISPAMITDSSDVASDAKSKAIAAQSKASDASSATVVVASAASDAYSLASDAMSKATVAMSKASDASSAAAAVVSTASDAKSAASDAASKAVVAMSKASDASSAAVAMTSHDHGILEANVSWDPPSLAAGGDATQDITVTGAVLGDYVMVSMSAALRGLILTGYVKAADTVTIVLSNNGATTYNFSSQTFYVRVWPNTWGVL